MVNNMNTLEYAKNELNKYSFLVFGEFCDIQLVNKSYGNPFDDVIEICVHSGKGVICGSNPRAVLIGVYKLFNELGCRFLRPGKDGEYLVSLSINDCSLCKTYKPENRYRGICSEGAISEQHVVDMIEWLPKIGMNSYFLQFTDGHLFFEKWYKHKESSVLEPEEYSANESAKHYNVAVETIKRCGLILQAVGHGWTTEPLGYVTYGDIASKDEDIKDEHRELFALINGKRGFFKNKPGDTHLCYSNPKAREMLVNSIVDYAKKHKEVDLLHFWLADGIKNHCECDNCKKSLPSDLYVLMLNDLDKKLTEAGIDTKIVFLIYCDLLFAPKKEKLLNPERFIMMYAPIARNYFDSPLYEQINFDNVSTESIPSFCRNKNEHPKTGAQYLSYLIEWQKVVNCDSFVFDYHLMMFQYEKEPSFTRISRVLYEEMATLKRAGLNGNISCQLQRIFLPTSLPNYVMAERLFGSSRSFEEIEEECLKFSFGEIWQLVRVFLHRTEEFYMTDFMQNKNLCVENISNIQDFKDLLIKIQISLNSYEVKNLVEQKSINNLQYFVKVQILFVSILMAKAENKDFCNELKALNSYIDEQEISVHTDEDCMFRKLAFSEWLGVGAHE